MAFQSPVDFVGATKYERCSHCGGNRFTSLHLTGKYEFMCAGCTHINYIETPRSRKFWKGAYG